ncbi:MAG: hypothetical protein LBJ90_01010, partial [Treponema sp.]|nr:hypothetical protein [Treponema sp.]
MKAFAQPFIGTTAEWNAANPRLYDGVPGVEDFPDGKRFFKLGKKDPANPDLTLRWQDLPYIDETYIKGLPEHLKAIEEEIDAEALARQEADKILQQNIDAEALAREQADERLQENIDAEAQARQEADELLQKNIDAEAQARQEADKLLQQNIDAEALAREQADGLLQQNIDAEALARQTADELLQKEIDGIEPYSEKAIDELRYMFAILRGFVEANHGPIYTFLGA